MREVHACKLKLINISSVQEKIWLNFNCMVFHATDSDRRFSSSANIEKVPRRKWGKSCLNGMKNKDPNY